MKKFSATLTMLLMAGSAFAQTAGTITYGPAAFAAPPVQAVPIPLLFLAPLGIALAFFGYRALQKQGAQRFLGALFIASGLAISVSSSLHIQGAIAAAATAVELNNPAGGTVDIPDTDAIYTNTSGVSLEIGNVAPAPNCASNTPADECVSGMELADGESCSTVYTCVLPVVSVGNPVDGVEAATPTNGVFTLSRTGDTTAALTVHYSLAGTATVDDDYTDTHAGEIEIPAGQSQVDVEMTVNDDNLYDPSETVELSIAADTAYTVGTGNAELEITALDRRIFVTSGSWKGNLGGISGADTKCAADVNNPDDGADFKALLGASSRGLTTDWVLSAGARYFRANDPSVFVTDVVSATGWLRFDLQNPVSATYLGAWTGLDAGGSTEDYTCNNWTSAATTPYYGTSGRSNSKNIQSIFYNRDGCNTSWHLYCVSQE